MTVAGNVIRGTAGAIGFDLNSKINSATAKQYVASGYRFCLRYVGRTDHHAANDLTEDEAATIVNAGLGLMVVQHYAGAGWTPTADLGTDYGRHAASNAANAGIPDGVNVFVDLEGIKKGTPAADVIAYCNNWFAAVETGGYVPGVYVGANAILSGDELYWDLKTTHYWKSGSSVPDIPHRGYQMIQTIKAGQVDRNVVKDDNFGNAVLWLAK